MDPWWVLVLAAVYVLGAAAVLTIDRERRPAAVRVRSFAVTSALLAVSLLAVLAVTGVV